MSYEKIPSFKPETNKNCSGHGIEILDNELTEKSDRNLLVKCLNNYITNEA